MSQRVQTTKEERERIERQFATIVTSLFDEYVVFDGDNSVLFVHKEGGISGVPVPFTREHVKVTQIWSQKKNKIAHIAHDNDDYWKLGIRFKNWRKKSPQKQFTTLVHEAAHLPDQLNHHIGHLGFVYDFDINGVDGRIHPLRFWITFAQLGSRINDRRHLFHESLYGTSVTGGPIICNALNNAARYASGIENAGNWQDAILDYVDYPIEYYRVFGEQSIRGLFDERYEEESNEEDIDSVTVEKVNFNMLTDEELYDEFGNDFELPEAEDHWKTPRIELPYRPRVKETHVRNGEPVEYEVEDGDEKLFALLARRGLKQVECEVTRKFR